MRETTGSETPEKPAGKLATGNRPPPKWPRSRLRGAHWSSSEGTRIALLFLQQACDAAWWPRKVTSVREVGCELRYYLAKRLEVAGRLPGTQAVGACGPRWRATVNRGSSDWCCVSRRLTKIQDRKVLKIWN